MADDSGELRSGMVMGHFQLDEDIGGGAMGHVWKGTDRRDGSRVAIKILNANFSGDPMFRQRFEREAHVATLLKSPYTVQTHAFGREAGHFYIVMEFVAGDSVEKLLRKGPLPLDEALEVANDAARALEAAAAHKIVHRDLKPSNIIVSPDGAAKLVDFGIAGTTLVQDAQGFMGTVHYAAPEQQKGQADERSDIYALGATLFHMLAGRPPYSGRTNDEVLAQHMHAPFPAPLLALHPEPVVDLVRRCMQKDAADRFPTAGDLAGAIERVRMRIVQMRDQAPPVLAAEFRTLVPEPEDPGRPGSGPQPAAPGGETVVLTGTGAGAARSVPGGETVVLSSPPAAPSVPGSAPAQSAQQGRPASLAMTQAPGVVSPPAAAPPPASPPPATPSTGTIITPPPRPEAPQPSPAPSATPPPARKSRKGLLIGIVGALVLVAGGGGAVLALSGGGGDDEKADETSTPATSVSRTATTPGTSATGGLGSATTAPATASATTAAPSATTAATATTAPPTATTAATTTTQPPATATTAPPTATPTTPARPTFSVAMGGGCGGLEAAVTYVSGTGAATVVGSWSGGPTQLQSSSAQLNPGDTGVFSTPPVAAGTYTFTATVNGAAVASGRITC